MAGFRQLGALVTVATGLGAVLGVGCSSGRPVTVPMRTLVHTGAGAHRCLVVFLPGRGDRAEDFARRGFVADLRATYPEVDALAADAHMGYFRDGTMLERLREDVVGPARRRGYEEIWLVGISAGGTAAILYDGRYPGEVTGLVLLAPFVGDRETVREVAAAGGPRGWAPTGPAGEDFQVDVWRWARELPGSDSAERVFLLFGARDRLAAGHRLLAGALPPGAVFTAPGGHDWRTWRTLWRAFLSSGVLGGCGAPVQ